MLRRLRPLGSQKASLAKRASSSYGSPNNNPGLYNTYNNNNYTSHQNNQYNPHQYNSQFNNNNNNNQYNPNQYNSQYNNNQYNNQYNNHQKKPFFSFRKFATVISVSTISYFFYLQCFNPIIDPFPIQIRLLLQQAVQCQSDPAKALKLYIEALEVADSLDIDPVSDQYTEIQLQIATNYEALGLDLKAQMIYLEIMRAYEHALLTNKVDIYDRPYIIQKLLRVLIKNALLCGETIPDHMSLLILQYLQETQNEVINRLGGLDVYPGAEDDGPPFSQSAPRNKILGASSELASSHRPGQSNNNRNRSNLPSNGFPYPISTAATGSLDDDDDDLTPTLLDLNAAWAPFAPEFFTARDLFLCLTSTSNRFNVHSSMQGAACQATVTTNQWMSNAGAHPAEVMKSYNACGSILYTMGIQIERLGDYLADSSTSESDNALQLSDSLLRNSAEAYKVVIDISKKNSSIKNLSLPLSALRPVDITDILVATRQELKDKQKNKDETSSQSRFSILNALRFQVASEAVYQKVMKKKASLYQKEMLRQTAVAHYGLALVSLNDGDFHTAERMLRHARIIAKDVNDDIIIGRVEEELEKLSKQKESVKDGDRHTGPGVGVEWFLEFE
ncbi:hypothetical protein DASC09_062270 [Saccharomycopsis crataegensis]|uniref:Uncharacterized protein n=1 Tax=Saccharomycopsis crataegensis TaxID=43959 RepID=A0AAV5QVL4_9ASCO|nr:hypothetical protein DASC09_062270 [Saccharomycopsis crataegensis]